MKRLISHLLNTQFRIDSEAKIAAAKAFLIANTIKNDRNISLKKIKYTLENIDQIRDVQLSTPYNWANKLKAVLPEAFYYIWQGIKE